MQRMETEIQKETRKGRSLEHRAEHAKQQVAIKQFKAEHTNEQARIELQKLEMQLKASYSHHQL